MIGGAINDNRSTTMKNDHSDEGRSPYHGYKLPLDCWLINRMIPESLRN